MLTDLQLRELCLKDYFFFVRYMNRTPKGVAPVSEHIHGPLCDYYGDPKVYRGGIAMPRDWLKSTIFTKWGPIWRYLKDHEERILIAAENEKLAARFLGWIELQILHNKRLRRIFPELLEIDKAYTKSNPWSKSECLLPREGIYSEPTITAIGVQGAAQSGHYTTIQIDDLVGKAAAESELVLDSVRKWFDNVNELLVQPHHSMPSPSRVWIIGTFWFPGDFMSYVHETSKDYQFLVTPCRHWSACEDEPGLRYIQNPTVDEGESNWPDQFPTEHYVEMLANPEKELIYWAQHMNMPKNAGVYTKFDLAWVRWWHYEDTDGGLDGTPGLEIVLENVDGTELMRIRPNDLAWKAFFDPGGFAEKMKMTKGDSRNAIVIGASVPGTIYKIVRYTWAARFKSPDILMNEVFKAHEECHPTLWRQEIFGQQEYILRDIKQESKRRGIPLTIIPFDHDTKKDAKDLAILGLVKPFFNGEIFLHRNMKDLLGEITTYPKGITKDLIDMLAQLNKHYWPRGAGIDVTEINRKNHEGSLSTPQGRTTGY
jgi:hypothetical protein